MSNENIENVPPEDQQTKKKRGRPRKFAKNGTVIISASIERRQQEWLSEIAHLSVEESASKIVREALDLWYRVNVLGENIAAPERPRYRMLEPVDSANESPVATLEPEHPSFVLEDDDDYDYNWQ